MNFNIIQLVKDAIISKAYKKGITKNDDIQRLKTHLDELYSDIESSDNNLELKPLSSFDEVLLNSDSVAFHAHKEPQKIKSLMIDENNQLKPFYKFYNEPKHLHPKHHQTNHQPTTTFRFYPHIFVSS